MGQKKVLNTKQAIQKMLNAFIKYDTAVSCADVKKELLTFLRRSVPMPMQLMWVKHFLVRIIQSVWFKTDLTCQLLRPNPLILWIWKLNRSRLLRISQIQ